MIRSNFGKTIEVKEIKTQALAAMRRNFDSGSNSMDESEGQGQKQ
jgi:hypothetical protein